MAIYALTTTFFNLTAGLNEAGLNFITLYYSPIYGKVDTTRHLSKLIHERIGNNKSVIHVQQEDTDHPTIHKNDPHFSFKDLAQSCQTPHMHFKCEELGLNSLFNHFVDVITIAGNEFEIANNAKNKKTKDEWEQWATDNKQKFSNWMINPHQSDSNTLNFN